MVKTRRIDPEFRVTTPVVKLLKKTFIGISLAVTTVTVISMFGLQDYFPLHPEREIERERRKNELITDDYRYMMEEARRIMKEEYTDEIQYSNMRQPHATKQ